VLFFFAADTFEQVNQRLVFVHCFRCKTWKIFAEIIITDFGVFGHCTRKVTFAERAIGHESNPKFLTGL
jgi:hypothetical protein